MESIVVGVDSVVGGGSFQLAVRMINGRSRGGYRFEFFFGSRLLTLK